VDEREGQRDGGNKPQRSNGNTAHTHKHTTYLVDQIFVMGLEQLGRGLFGLESDKLVTLLFKAADNVSDNTPLDAIRLDLLLRKCGSGSSSSGGAYGWVALIVVDV
jgi:hypothetical protein